MQNNDPRVEVVAQYMEHQRRYRSEAANIFAREILAIVDGATPRSPPGEFVVTEEMVEAERDPARWRLIVEESEDPWTVIASNGNWVAHCATREAAERIVAAVNAHETPGAAAPETNEDLAWNTLIRAAIQWAQHLDQWDKFQFDTKFGPVYVSISRETQYPESYDRVPYDYQDAMIPAKAMDPGAAVLPGGEIDEIDMGGVIYETNDVVDRSPDPAAQAGGVAPTGAPAQVARNPRELPDDRAQGILADGVAPRWTAEKEALLKEIGRAWFWSNHKPSAGDDIRRAKFNAAFAGTAAPAWPPDGCPSKVNCIARNECLHMNGRGHDCPHAKRGETGNG